MISRTRDSTNAYYLGKVVVTNDDYKYASYCNVVFSRDADSHCPVWEKPIQNTASPFQADAHTCPTILPVPDVYFSRYSVNIFH